MTRTTPDLSTAAAEAAKADAARRAIETADNPDPRVDYLIRLQAEAALDLPRKADVTLVLVPDKRIVHAGAFAAYLGRLDDLGPEAPGLPERLALRILEDLNDELVPRWMQVTVAPRDGGGHRVLVEDRQPRWDNKALLARVGGL